jgi:hypothetical protein
MNHLWIYMTGGALVLFILSVLVFALFYICSDYSHRRKRDRSHNNKSKARVLSPTPKPERKADDGLSETQSGDFAREAKHRHWG